MSSQARRFSTLGTALVLGFSLFAAPTYAQTGPFQNLAGNWSGAGTITFSNGSRERIRCRVAYAVQAGGGAMQQELRCASDSYRFDVSSTVQSSGANLSGQWTEVSRGVTGSVTGQANSSQLEALIQAPGFVASLSMRTSGNKQTVTLRPTGFEVSDVSVALSRSR